MLLFLGTMLPFPWDLRRKNTEAGDSVVFHQVPLISVFRKWVAFGSWNKFKQHPHLLEQAGTDCTLRLVSDYWTASFRHSPVRIIKRLSDSWIQLEQCLESNILALPFLSSHTSPVPPHPLNDVLTLCISFSKPGDSFIILQHFSSQAWLVLRNEQQRRYCGKLPWSWW